MDYFKSFGIDVGKGNYHEEIIYGVALIYNLLNNEISTYLSEYDLSVGKFNVLMTIKHQGGKEGISQVDVSKHLIVTPSNMTRLLDKLEEEKLVDRYPLEGDRRVNLVKITDRGTKLLDDVWPEYNKKLQELIMKLSVADKKALSALLIKWFEKLNE